MEPIVAVIEVDHFAAGGVGRAKTWPTGTLVEITPIVSSSDKRQPRPDGRPLVYAKPIGHDSTSYTLHSGTDDARRTLGQFVQPPNNQDDRRGTHDVVHFTPNVNNAGPVTADNPAYVLLADPVTVNGPGDVLESVKINGSTSVDSCGPKYISAAVGGVCTFDWPSSEYPGTVRYANDMIAGPTYAMAGSAFSMKSA